MLLGVVGERVSNRAIDLIESTTRRKIARLLENHRRDPADPTDAEGEPEQLGADEERQLHAVLLGWGVGMRMEADAAGQLADSVIEALLRRGSEDR